MKRSGWYVIGGLLLAAFAGFSLLSFRQSLTPYVAFEKAEREGKVGRSVQVMGALDKGTSSYDSAERALLFTLEEPTTSKKLRVRFHGVRPANFEDAISIVAIGHYDEKAQEFAASKLLVKCPSKYQGAEVKTYS